MNRLSLRNNQLKFEISGELSIILEKSAEEYTSNEWQQNWKMSTCNRLDLESLGSWPTMPKNFPGSDSDPPLVALKWIARYLVQIESNNKIALYLSSNFAMNVVCG